MLGGSFIYPVGASIPASCWAELGLCSQLYIAVCAMGKVNKKKKNQQAASPQQAVYSSSHRLATLHRPAWCLALGKHERWREGFVLDLRQRDHRPVNIQTHVLLAFDAGGFGRKNFPEAD